MKKKIGLLISTLNSGGAERVVSRLSSLLSDQYDIYVILFEDTYMCYEYKGKLVNLDVKCRNDNFFRKIMLPLKRTLRLRKVKKNLNLDSVISFLDSPNIVNILSRTKNCKVIVSVRNYSNKEKRLSIVVQSIDFIMKILYKKADKIIAVSNVISESLTKDYNVKKDKIKTIYNPYDIEQINELAIEELEDYHKEFMDNGKIFISVGRQMYQKGFWHLVKAFKILKDKCPDVKLVIVGKDYQDGLVKKLVNELGIEECVLLTGYERNPFKFIKNSDIYILSSMFEGFPNSMAEALVCGCPVIAADCKSGPREILYRNADINKEAVNIEEADYGILVPSLNELENWSADSFDESDLILSKAMYELIVNIKLRDLYSKKAVERAKDFNLEVCKQQYINILESY